MKVKYSVIDTKSGHKSLEIMVENKKVFLHSKIDPSRERPVIMPEDAEKFDCIICLGAGLGYHLQNLDTISSSFKKIIIIDALDDVKILLNEGLLGSIFEKENIEVLGAPATDSLRIYLSKIIDFSEIKGVKVVEHPASARLFQKYYSDIKKIITEIINVKAGSEGAKKAFGIRYLKNCFVNLSFAVKKKCISSLKNIHKGSTACIVTSGPTLENYFQWIVQNRESLVLIAVDSAVKPLKAQGLTADYIVSIDPQPYVYEHLMGESLAPGKLIAAMTAHPLVMKKAEYLFLNSHPLCQLINEINNNIGSIDSATGSVAGDAVYLSYFLGCTRALLLGYDFSFSNEIIYTRGTSYQKRFSRIFQNRIDSVENQNFRYIVKSCKGFRFDGLRSRRAFIQYKESLEGLLQSIDSVKFLQPIGSPFVLKGAEAIGMPCVVTEKLYGSNDIYDIDMKVVVNEIKKFLRNDDIYREIIKAATGSMKNSERYRKLL